MKTYLYCEYEDKDIVKDHGGRWDAKFKKWFCIGEITEELQCYEEVEIDIPYEDKEYYKSQYSIRWSPDKRSWITNYEIACDIETNRMYPD